MLLEIELVERHVECGRRHFGFGRGDTLIVHTNGFFLDLNGAAFDTVNELAERRILFRRDRRFSAFLARISSTCGITSTAAGSDAASCGLFCSLASVSLAARPLT